MTVISPTQLTKRWIDLPVVTFGLAQGAAFRHGVEIIQAKLATPDELVAGLILQRRGDVVPSLAMAHLDDPFVITATVVAMHRAMKSSILMGLLSPVVNCQSFAVSGDWTQCERFFQAVKQTFWSNNVECKRMVPSATETGDPCVVLYDLSRNEVSLAADPLSDRSEIIPTFDLAARIWERQTRSCGQICALSRKRRQLAGTTYVDTGCDNFTGDDSVRMPFKLFNLQNPRLKGYVIG